MYYSEFSDHKIVNGVYTGTNDWTTEPYSYATVKAIRIELAQLVPAQEGFEIIVPMSAPTEYTFTHML